MEPHSHFWQLSDPSGEAFFSGQSKDAGFDNDSILEFVFGVVSGLGLKTSQFCQFLEFRFNPVDTWWGGGGLWNLASECVPLLLLFHISVPLQLTGVGFYSCF